MKVWLVCLAHNNPKYVMEAMTKYKDQNKEIAYDHEYIMVDCHYPLPNPRTNSVDIASIAEAFNMTHIKPYRNRGVSKNWQWVMGECGMKDDDIMVGLDPDGRVRESGWVNRVVDVFRHEPRAYFVGLNQYSHGGHKNLSTVEYETTAGTKYLEFPRIVAWSLGGWHVGRIRLIGGPQERRPFYGFIEDETHARMLAQGDYTFFKLKDYYDFHKFDVDPLYVDWKKAMVEERTRLPFNEWLKEETCK